MNPYILLALIGIVVAGAVAMRTLGQPGSGGGVKPAAVAEAAQAPTGVDPAYVLGYTVKDIDGNDVNLEDFKGKVILIVNVASKCGLTPQYEGLEKLYGQKKDQGFVVLGFPANNFMGQEPGTEAEIKAFCSTKYNVTFPMFSKVSVKDKDAHPLFAQLSALPEPAGGEPSWNFTKYLIGRDGRAVQRFGPRVGPSDKDLIAKVDELLKQP